MGEKVIKRQLGIDFGTTTTSMAYCDDKGTAEVIMIQGKEYIPSLIIEGNDKHAERYGEDAKSWLQNFKELRENFKLDLISENIEIRMKAEELTRKYFRFLFNGYGTFAEKQLLQKGEINTAIVVERTVVTYPGKFPVTVRDFLKNAAEAAGFKNVFMLTEAEAAMMCARRYDNKATRDFFRKNTGAPLNVMMIDMGGGTTDIVIFQYDVKNGKSDEKPFFFPNQNGFNFGGNIIDKRLYDYYTECNGKPLAEDEKKKRRLQMIIKDYKESTISVGLNNDETVDEPYMMPEGKGTLDRGSFEKILDGYLSEFPKLIKGALSGAERAGKIHDKKIDLVLLIGGNSQWYFVREMLMNQKLVELPIIQNDASRIIGFVTQNSMKSSIPMVAIGAAYYSKPEPSSAVKTQLAKSVSVTKPAKPRIEIPSPIYTSTYPVYKNCYSHGFLGGIFGCDIKCNHCAADCTCDEVCTRNQDCDKYNTCRRNCYDCRDCDYCNDKGCYMNGGCFNCLGNDWE